MLVLPRQAIQRHLIHIGYERLTKQTLQIINGKIKLHDKPGLGIELDMEQVNKAHQLYKKLPNGARNDGIAMQYLIPNWKFDRKRPCMVR